MTTDLYTRDGYEQAALLRLANTLRGTEFGGLVLRINHDAPLYQHESDRRTIQVVSDGQVVASLTPSQVLHATEGVLLYSVRHRHGAL